MGSIGISRLGGGGIISETLLWGRGMGGQEGWGSSRGHEEEANRTEKGFTGAEGGEREGEGKGGKGEREAGEACGAAQGRRDGKPTVARPASFLGITISRLSLAPHSVALPLALSSTLRYYRSCWRS